ncbi:Uncharacterized membrane protein YdfJ, MMPL/SSD domain [Nonomuraea solani]|uniref:Uncharacterized membrane protein YdfJ, MMPL/SSD domain n=1 Tax=Nonomuraea solani TaxID=1144553 RepID=A0A1H6ES91_9ACTN|nr:Uncharacterized membrane protein YdfJ, MMPL/SSD domain [Nonomuraea solani]
MGVVLCWVALAIAAMLTSGPLDDVRVTSGTSMLARNAESARVHDLLAEQGGRVVPALVVYERSGPIEARDHAEAARDLREFAGVQGVVGTAAAPAPSPDGRALQATVLLTGKPGVLINPLVERLRQIVAEGRPPGLSGHVSGAGGAAADYVDSFRRVDGTLLALSIGVVFLVLLAVYRSPVLWVIPMLAVVVAYLCSAAAVYALAEAGWMTLRGVTPEVFTVLVFGVATDYALLLIARYRERLRVTADQKAALKGSLAGGIRTVVASALTVAGGVGCLLVADTNALRSIGAAAAVGIVITMAVMVTFLPALMLLGGRRAFWPATPRPGQVGRDRLWPRVAAFVGRRPRLSWAGSALLLALFCGGLTTLDPSGIPPSALFTLRMDSVAGYDALKRHYPAAAPVVVLARQDQSTAVAEAARRTTGVLSVQPAPPPQQRTGGTLSAPPPGQDGTTQPAQRADLGGATRSARRADVNDAQSSTRPADRNGAAARPAPRTSPHGTTGSAPRTGQDRTTGPAPRMGSNGAATGPARQAGENSAKRSDENGATRLGRNPGGAPAMRPRHGPDGALSTRSGPEANESLSTQLGRGPDTVSARPGRGTNRSMPAQPGHETGTMTRQPGRETNGSLSTRPERETGARTAQPGRETGAMSRQPEGKANGMSMRPVRKTDGGLSVRPGEGRSGWFAPGMGGGLAGPDGAAGRWQVLDVVLAAEPNTPKAQQLVNDLRRSVHTVAGGAALVGGFTTEQLDTKDAALDDALLVIPLILLVVGLILIVLLRSLVAPLLLIGTVVLSVAATLGLCSALFTQVLGYPAVDPSFMLYAFVFLIAFGIDYNIFLMARVREEGVRLDTRAATLHGLRATGGVITAAGVVLAAAFFVLTVLPLVPVIQLGLLVAIGVVVDTVIVRSFLVPALAHHLGRAIWWPARGAL